MPAHTDQPGPGLPLVPVALAIVLGLAAVLYLAAAAAQARTGRGAWPAHRSVLWLAGLGAVAVAVLGPLAGAAHHDFAAHLATHLLVGMLAPLLITLSAPVTLALRSLDVPAARRLSRLLNSRYTRFLAAPVPAAVLDVGSLWLLYATPLGGSLMHHAGLLAVLPLHFFVAGYLFTAAVVGIDPAPHRRSFGVRLAVLALAIAAHSALAKHLYAHSPAGTSDAAARRGAMLMYYGGDLVELLLLVLLCAQWYRAARPVPLLPPAGGG
jgi:putative membrane protein